MNACFPRPRRSVAAAAWAAVATCLVGATGRAAAPGLHREPADRPVIGSGEASTPLLVMDPFVHADGEGYHLFFSSYFCRTPDGGLSCTWDPARPHDCDIGAQVTAIAYAFSADRGRTWTVRRAPVLAPGDAAWESGKVETAAIADAFGRLWIFYCADGRRAGKRLASRYQIGAASIARPASLRRAFLEQGAAFDRQGRTTPVLAGSFDRPAFGNNVQEPSVVVRDGRFELFYVGLSFASPADPAEGDGQRILAVGLGQAILDPALRVLARSAAPLLPGTTIAEVRHAGGRYHLFGTTHGREIVHGGEALNYASSPDGVRWDPVVPLLGIGAPGAYDGWAAMAPTAVARPEGGWDVFYTALGVEPRDCFPVPPGGRWGIPLPGRRCLYGTLGRATTATR